MKKNTGYIIPLLLIVLCICTIFAVSSKKVYADIASGTYDGLSWKITDDGELILGNGGAQTITSRKSVAMIQVLTTIHI